MGMQGVMIMRLSCKAPENAPVPEEVAEKVRVEPSDEVETVD
jgi:hypothetical protein